MRALLVALILAIATPSIAGTPWWQVYLESRRSTHAYLERQREAARDRRFIRCLVIEKKSAERCVRRKGRRR